MKAEMDYGGMEMPKIDRHSSDKPEPYQARPSSPSKATDVDITEIGDRDDCQDRLVPPKQDSTQAFSQYAPNANVSKTGWWERLLLTRDLWSPTWNIYLFCVMGIGFSFAHHAFYTSLDGKITQGDDQILMQRYGTVLAFAAKASFVASTMVAFRNQLWATIRSKMLTTATLDDMLAAHETPFSLLNLEFLTNAKVVALLALYSWFSPLVVILTTNTLLLQPAEEIRDAMCPAVPTLNFAGEVGFHGGDSMGFYGAQQMSLSLWNSTRENSSDYRSNTIDTWAGRSELSTEYFETAMKLNRSLTNFDDTFIVCERGWNCTIEVQFEGPAYKCQEIARGVGAKVGSLRQESGEVTSPISFEMLAPTGNYSWIGHTGLGDYALPQMDPDWERGRETDPPIPKNMGAFRTEPVVWIGYSEYINTSISPDSERSGNEYNPDAWEPVLIACEHYEALYTAELRYIDGLQVHRIKHRKFKQPIVNTTFVGYTATDDGTLDNTTAIPESNYILPTDLDRYGKTAAYHSFGAFIRSNIDGTIRDRQIARTLATKTNLIEPVEMIPQSDLIKRFPEHYEMFLLSLLGNPNYVALGWASNPGFGRSPLNVDIHNNSELMYPCTRSRPGVKYYYRTQILVLVYGVAALLAIMGVVVGTIALRKNGGVPRNTRFSSILAATRAKSLDQVDWDGPERDRAYVSGDLMRQKLGYGKLRSSESNEGHGDGSREAKTAEAQYGFGFEGEVDQTPAVRSRRAFSLHAAADGWVFGGRL